MNPALDRPLAVQDLDLAADRLRHRRAHLPERAELAAVPWRGGPSSVTGRRPSSESKSAGRPKRKPKRSWRPPRGGPRRSKRRLYSGEVSRLPGSPGHGRRPRDARAGVRPRGRVLELLEEREPLEARVASLAAELERALGAPRRLEVAARRAAEARGRRRAGRGRPAHELETAAKVPPTLLATYERLRPRLGGMGVARLVGNHCDGCHLILSAMELDRIRHLRDGEVVTCEQCVRILVRYRTTG